jgi:hypothetical protein
MDDLFTGKIVLFLLPAEKAEKGLFSWKYCTKKTDRIIN